MKSVEDITNEIIRDNIYTLINSYLKTWFIISSSNKFTFKKEDLSLYVYAKIPNAYILFLKQNKDFIYGIPIAKEKDRYIYSTLYTFRGFTEGTYLYIKERIHDNFNKLVKVDLNILNNNLVSLEENIL